MEVKNAEKGGADGIRKYKRHAGEEILGKGTGDSGPDRPGAAL